MNAAFLSVDRSQIREKQKPGHTTPPPDTFRFAQEVVV
jgi:hypothetical protein